MHSPASQSPIVSRETLRAQSVYFTIPFGGYRLNKAQLIISVTNPEEDTAALLSDTRSDCRYICSLAVRNITVARKCVGIPQAMNNLHVNELHPPPMIVKNELVFAMGLYTNIA